MRLSVSQPRDGSHARLADGNAITAVEIRWNDSPVREQAPESSSTIAVEVVLETIKDFAPVHAAITRLIENAEAGDTAMFSDAPFRGTRELRSLFAELGLATTPWCCEELPAMPKATLAPGDETMVTGDLPMASNEAVPTGFYRRCGSCHRGDTDMPPGFLRGPPTRVAANVSQCAERIYVRLGMWRLDGSRRTKSPMPPAVILGNAGTKERDAAELGHLFQHVGALLEARDGHPPDLGELMNRGYENLKECLPGDIPQ